MSIEWSDQPRAKVQRVAGTSIALLPLIAAASGPAVIFPRSLISG
jgi:hypothetical protein